MKPILRSLGKIPFLLFFLFISLSAFASLPDFTLTVTPTAQTCLGNGTLTFSTTGTTPGATMTFAVYLLPNTTTPLTTTSATTVNSLSAGTYQVVATQSLGGETSTATVNATIANNVVNLLYTLTPGNVTCNNNGTITVNVLQGVAVSYEIIAGPVTKPLQTSNVFTGLPAGLFQVRVYNNCGEATVVSVTLTESEPTFGIYQNSVDGGNLPSCTTIRTYNTISYSGVTFPLSVQYTVYPPGGGTPTIVNTTVNEADVVGPPPNITAIIPFYHNQTYSYDVQVTDSCGHVYTKVNNITFAKIELGITPDYPGCNGVMFTLEPHTFVGPWTVTFIEAPAGFDPEAYNSQQPTFTSDSADFGSELNPVPLGTYTVQITDACGHTTTTTVELEVPDVEPVYNVIADCGSTTGSININLGNKSLVQAVVLTAPDGFPGTLPFDASFGINDQGDLVLTDVPLGDYTFYLVDECGNEYDDFPVTVAPSQSEEGVITGNRPGCDEGIGSVRVRSTVTETQFTQAIITDAPDTYTATLPQDVSNNINIVPNNTLGNFFMNGLPEGDYTIQFTDQCNFVQTQIITVEGYHVGTNDFTVIPHCGSFDLAMLHESNGTYVQSFWLQKYDDATGTWGHPLTGSPYTSGLPNTANSVPLSNATTNLNNPYTGHFRVLKIHYIYSNGVSANFLCSSVLYEFDFDGGPEITAAYSFPCSGGLTEVALEVTGVPPFTYAITSKNGDNTFVVNNGSNNVFSGLEPALYNFQVTDDCGNVRNREFTITEEDPILITANGFCEGQLSTLSVPEYTFLSYQWYEQSNPTTILSTSGTLTFPSYNSATDAGTYVLNILAVNPESCLNQQLSYTIEPNALPNAGNDAMQSICNPFAAIELTQYLGTTYDAGGTWTDDDATGALTGSVFNTQTIGAGTYHFTYTVNGFCGLVDTATIAIELKDTPLTPVLTAVPGVCVGANVQFGANTVAGATYAWTGPNGFTSALQNPLLTGVTVAQSGDYSVTISLNGCTSPPATVTLTVSPLPYAGTDGAQTLCNTGDIIDLSEFLGTGYTTGGTWTDVDNSGALTNADFATSGVAAGVYHFKYEVTNFCGIPDDATVTITLNDVPNAPVIAAVAPLCEGSDVQLTTTTVPNAVYTWTGPNGFTSAQQNPLIAAATTAASGTYSLTVTVNGCASPVATVNVQVSPYPQFTFSGESVLCDGQTIQLDVVPGNFTSGSVTYTWYYEGSLLSGVNTESIEISETGTYTVEVSNGTCTSPKDFTVSPNTNAFEVVLDAGCENERYIIQVLNIDEISDVASIEWTGPNGFTAVGESADITDGATGTYVATVTTLNGCSAFAEVVVDNTHCFIPRGISPGDSEYNNEFDLSNLDVRHIEIFNRYGMQVYKKDNYINEWHGQSDKGDLPTGTYFYVITLSQGKQVTGWVYLLRKV
ncbi:gliding motility-associated C-terminal domain-containing protein [Flavobacterium sp. RHBU_3]|uniref:T9SS type B sorting domain-containing protein n=1 Tax=Flavobacterium sp. RHBU_3 TaxID=3391184 RepID=UPI00398494B1